MTRRLRVFAIVICLLVLLSNSLIVAGTPKTPPAELIASFIDVGQADCILLQQGSNYMLVDAGNNGDSKTIKSYLDKQGVKELKYFVGTHKDEDHIGSADTVISTYKVGKVYFPKQTATTQTFIDFTAAVEKKNLKLTVPKVGDQFKLGEANVTVLAPKGNDYKDSNDYSIVLNISFGKTTFLLEGDAGVASEEEMIKSKLDLSATLLKISHHGSRTATSQEFLDKVNPKYAVISVEKDNKYGLPDEDVLNRLKEKKIPVYRTDEQGTLVATSNGKDITFNVKAGSYKAAPQTTTPPSAAGSASSGASGKQQASFAASVDNASPKQNSTIKLSVSGPGGKFTAICHYKSTNTQYTGTVGQPIDFKIGRAAVGYKVIIDISITYEGKSYKTQTSFTPQ